ncbi:hypothetical protein GQX74_008255, partial [Glossina fuscipes]
KKKMDSSYVKTPIRYVIEDSITKVTSDGEPHEMMTMIAGLSGFIVALIILAILLFFVISKRSHSLHECHRCSVSSSVISKRPSASDSVDTDVQSKRTSIETIYEEIGDAPVPRSASVAIIYTGNLQRNLNKAFESSELNLQSCLTKGIKEKKHKRTHWQDEVEKRQAETAIQIERY